MSDALEMVRALHDEGGDMSETERSALTRVLAVAEAAVAWIVTDDPGTAGAAFADLQMAVAALRGGEGVG